MFLNKKQVVGVSWIEPDIPADERGQNESKTTCLLAVRITDKFIGTRR